MVSIKTDNSIIKEDMFSTVIDKEKPHKRMEINRTILQDAIERSFAKDTSSTPDEWSKTNAGRGCAKRF